MQKGSIPHWQEEDGDCISTILDMFVIVEITDSC